MFAKKFRFEDFSVDEIKQLCEGGNSIPLEKNSDGIYEKANATGLIKKSMRSAQY